MDLKIESQPLKVTRTFPYRFGIISDLQVGCQMAIFPPNFTDSSGNKYTLNKGQEKLWNYMSQFIGEMEDSQIETLFVVGDLVAGQNWAELGAYLVTSGMNMRSQVEACAEVLRYICEKVPTIRNVYLWKGTPYHGLKGTVVEQSITDRLQALKPEINVVYAGEYSYITIAHGDYKKVMWIAHPSTHALVYPETVLGRDIMFFHDAYAQGKLPKVDVVLRGHGHYSMELHKATVRYIMLPCWQFFVPYDKAVKYYSKFQPDIGGYIVMFDDKLRMTAWHFLYPNLTNPERFIHVVQNPEGKIGDSPMSKEMQEILKKRK